MPSETQTVQVSKAALWGGRIMSVVPVLLMLFSGVTKVMKPAPIGQGFAKFGYPESLILGIGILEILCCLIYLIPRTSILGVILLTGYLGRATATNVRVSDPSSIVTVILGLLIWGGLYLREERLRALIPLRS